MNVCPLARRAGFCLAVLGLALIGQTRARTQTVPVTHTVTLRDARVSKIDGTHIVITAEALGDIKGSISLHLESEERGWLGTWAFVSSYVRDTNPDGTPAAESEHHSEEPHHHEGAPGDAPHREYMEFVRDGGMNGTVNGATLAQTPEGALTGLSSPLVLLEGTQTFDGATGVGELSLTQLEDTAHSTGTLTLIF